MTINRIAKIVTDHALNVNCLIFWRPIVYLHECERLDFHIYIIGIIYTLDNNQGRHLLKFEIFFFRQLGNIHSSMISS